jgi:hypothetical protein
MKQKLNGRDGHGRAIVRDWTCLADPCLARKQAVVPTHHCCQGFANQGQSGPEFGLRKAWLAQGRHKRVEGSRHLCVLELLTVSVVGKELAVELCCTGELPHPIEHGFVVGKPQLRLPLAIGGH